MENGIKNGNVYILSLEGAEIYEHMKRKKNLKYNYVGMISYSLELEKLKKQGLKTFTSNKTDKIMSKDIINVKFNQKIKSANEIINILTNKLDTEIDMYAKNKIKNKLEELNKLKEKEEWQEIKNEELRNKLYNEGFVITEIDKITGEIKETKYVVYKRSSAKSRTGQVLFIKEKLHNKMIKWARMGMNLDNRSDIDYPSLLSYESLVSSSLEDTIHIDIKNILIVNDVKSIFTINVNVVEKNKDGLLISRPENNYKMESDIFDGEGIADKSIFIKANRKDKGMMLLRQHMFKSCVFNTNIQAFLKDHCPENIEYDKWEIKNMYGETMLAKDVLMAITPNSLKALKFSKIKGTKKKMWNHWKNIVLKENCIFGICKSEKESKKGYDDKGNVINQTSYQMLNCMPISSTDMIQLSQFELNYIEKLKNNDDVYVEYLLKNVNDMNCNEMLINLYKRNKNITHTKIFKDIRKKDINNYITHAKKGKIRLKGDYCTIFQNGKEFLYHIIGLLPITVNNELEFDNWKNEMILKDNEVYTTLHTFDKEYVGFRNPNTSPSNVLIVKNKQCNFIKKYFNFTNNIIYTNAINFEINRILSGQDVDSDTLVLFNSKYLLENAKKCYKKYRVCVNNVDTDLNKYKVCSKDMSKIDNILSNSQKYIGRVVNLGQLYMSTYWDLVNKNCGSEETLKQLMEKVDVCTVLSEIAIDSAKRMYDLDIKKQIDDLSKNKLLLDNKPNFFKYVSKNDNIDDKIKKYKTSMDYLQDIFTNVKVAEERNTIDLEKLLKDRDSKKVKYRQVNNLIKAINHMQDNIKYIYTFTIKDKEDKKELYNALDNAKREHMSKIKKYKIKTETIYVIIQEVFKGRIECTYKTELLNTLYKINPDSFLLAFKEK